MKIKFLLFSLLIGVSAYAQNGVIEGRVFNAINNEPLDFATVVVQNTTKGAKTDTNGNYKISGLEPGLYTLQVSTLGYEKKLMYEIAVDNYKSSFVDVPMKKKAKAVKGVKIVGQREDRNEESPLSLKTIGVNEIRRNPGGNRDISKVIQSLPGAGSSVGFRNDIIIRGGGPTENRFFIDGIEIPNINHFATQGAGGGPVGILNVDFLRDVGYFSGAFPASRGNTMSSVFDFQLKNPRRDKWSSAFTLGTSDIGIRTDGPINEKSGMMLSVRRSYLQLLFKAIGLPFLPTYNDMQFKYKHKINAKNEISYIMLGAYDNSVLNIPDSPDASQQYILGYLPEQNQWNYTNGIVYKHFSKNSFQTVTLSRNMLSNRLFKYTENDESLPLTFENNSREIENKLRFEHNTYAKDWKLTAGAGAQYVKYTNDNFQQFGNANGGVDSINFDAAIAFMKYSAFGQLSKQFLDNKFSLSLGLRMDGHSFTESAKNPFNQISPRLSASYNLSPKFSLNFNVGRYYQVPSYTILGYKDTLGNYVNRDNDLPYIRCDHLVAGIEYRTNKNTRFSVESFYKVYDNYPMSVYRGISLANLGGDFGVVGVEPVTPTSIGRAYGLELFAQQKFYKGFYGLAAVTLFRSEFTNAGSSDFVASSWDQRFIINLTAGKKFKRNIEVGAKFRLSGGRPFTPFDSLLSSVQSIWDAQQQGILDYTQINSGRLPFNHQLDIRVDKKWFFKKWNLNLYLDLQNLYAMAAAQPEILTVQRDAAGNPILDPASMNPSRYRMQYLNNNTGTLLPTLGIIIEY